MSEAKKAKRVREEDYALSGIQLPDGAAREFVFPAHVELEKLALNMGDLAPAIWIMRGCGLRAGIIPRQRPSYCLRAWRRPQGYCLL